MTLIDNEEQMQLRAFLDSIRDRVLKMAGRRIRLTFYVVLRICTVDGYRRFAVMTSEPYDLEANEISWNAMRNRVCNHYERPIWADSERWSFVAVDSVLVE